MLKQDEAVRLDSGQLEKLYEQLGEAGAEDVVCRALEELALRLAQTERAWREGRLAEMRKSARGLIAIADQIGLNTLAEVARDVTVCVDSGDANAQAATVMRLVRIGERSLSEVWDLQDVTL
ncbi:hypothetical protein K1T73_14160 [Roseovarius sp. SCSIO 43702]|uniref:hypothetical protein n=1 Tax=Roseovarius sp. SCSIO 43702 TaxID=2823043 RepID=UPI001C7300C2|nr:hypothetical protein K1T73_14160 [Roseovarius sp. SCSIO 43702]